MIEQDFGAFRPGDTHEAHLKSLSHLEQTIGNQNHDWFKVFYDDFPEGPSHRLVFTANVEVVFMNNEEEPFLGEGQGKTKREAQKAALFNFNYHI